MQVDFTAALNSSNSAQDAVVIWLQARGFIVEDLRDDMEAQKRGIDLKFSKADRAYTGEVKQDAWISKTHNFALEIISNLSKGTPGCWISSQADVWFYVDSVSKVLHIFKPSEVKQAVSVSDKVKWSCSLSATSDRGGGVAYRTVSLLVPFDTVSSTHSYRKYVLNGEETF